MKILNLTQHPATPAQVEAGVIEVEEDRGALVALLNFDTLPSIEEISRRAERISAFAKGCDAAMIGGAPYLMRPLEDALNRRGVNPVYAFSVRESAEEIQPDGTVRKTNVFRHAGFIGLPTKGTKKVSYRDGRLNRGRRQMLIVRLAGKLYRFAGQNIKGVVLIEQDTYIQQGKWSHTDYELTIPVDAVLFREEQDFSNSRWLDGCNVLEDVAARWSVSVEEAYRFLRDDLGAIGSDLLTRFAAYVEAAHTMNK